MQRQDNNSSDSKTIEDKPTTFPFVPFEYKDGTSTIQILKPIEELKPDAIVCYDIDGTIILYSLSMQISKLVVNNIEKLREELALLRLQNCLIIMLTARSAAPMNDAIPNSFINACNIASHIGKTYFDMIIFTNGHSKDTPILKLAKKFKLPAYKTCLIDDSDAQRSACMQKGINTINVYDEDRYEQVKAFAIEPKEIPEQKLELNITLTNCTASNKAIPHSVNGIIGLFIDTLSQMNCDESIRLFKKAEKHDISIVLIINGFYSDRTRYEFSKESLIDGSLPLHYILYTNGVNLPIALELLGKQLRTQPANMTFVSVDPFLADTCREAGYFSHYLNTTEEQLIPSYICKLNEFIYYRRATEMKSPLMPVQPSPTQPRACYILTKEMLTLPELDRQAIVKLAKQLNILLVLLFEETYFTEDLDHLFNQMDWLQTSFHFIAHYQGVNREKSHIINHLIQLPELKKLNHSIFLVGQKKDSQYYHNNYHIKHLEFETILNSMHNRLFSYCAGMKEQKPVGITIQSNSAPRSSVSHKKI